MLALLLQFTVVVGLFCILLLRKMLRSQKQSQSQLKNKGAVIRFTPEPHLASKVKESDVPAEPPEVKPKIVLRLQKGERSMLDMGFKAKKFPIDYQTEFQKVDLAKLLRSMVQTGLHTDVQLNIGDCTFHCHSLVLQGYSQYFHQTHIDPIMYLPEQSITPRGFQLAYSWMLADVPTIEREGFMELYQASVFLRITDLHKQLMEYLQTKRFFHEDLAFYLYMEAKQLKLRDVHQMMLPLLNKIFLAVVASRDFLHFDIEELCQLLQSDNIAVHTEMDVLMAAVRWAAHDWKTREAHVARLGRCIRFRLLDAVVLVSLNGGSDSAEIKRFIENPVIQQLITDAIAFAAATEAQDSKLPPTFLRVLTAGASGRKPTQRKLVDETLYIEPYKYCCENKDKDSYESFLFYLDMVRTVGKNHWRTLQARSDETRRVTFLEDVKSLSDDSSIRS